MKVNKILFSVFLLVIGIWLFVFTLKTINFNQVSKFFLSIFSWKFIALLLFGFLAVIALSAIRDFIILKHQKQKITLKTVFSAELTGFAFSYLTPITFAGGEPFRYVMLKNRGIEPSCAISSILIEKIVLFLMMAIAFLVGIAFFLIYIPLPYGAQLGLLLFLLVGMFVFLFFYYKTRKIVRERGLILWLLDKLFLSKLKSINSHKDQIQNIENQIIDFLCKKSKARNSIFIISILETLLAIMFFWLCIYFIIEPISIGKLFVVNNAINLSAFMPLPAALGVSEISQAYIFNQLGLTQETGFTFSLLLRCIYLVFSLFGCIIFVVCQIQDIKEKIYNFFKK